MNNFQSRNVWKWGLFTVCFLVQLLVAYFCWFGFRASFEPPVEENWGARVIYGVVGLACLLGAMAQVLFLLGYRLQRPSQ